MWENFQHEFQRYFVDNGASDWWLNGLKTTILVTLLALCIGVILGFLVALIRSTHEQTGKLKLLNASMCGISDSYPWNTFYDTDPDLLFRGVCQHTFGQHYHRRHCLWYRFRSLCGGDRPFRYHVH